MNTENLLYAAVSLLAGYLIAAIREGIRQERKRGQRDALSGTIERVEDPINDHHPDPMSDLL